MRLYRHAKYWVCIGCGVFSVYHDAQWAAVACFVLAALQPKIAQMEASWLK